MFDHAPLATFYHVVINPGIKVIPLAIKASSQQARRQQVS